MKIFVLTGEFSGETHAAKVLGELIRQKPGIKIKAMGSKLLEAFGAEIVADYNDYSVSGFTEVALNIVRILELKKKIVKSLREFRPNILLLVDFAGFNLEIAKYVKKELPEIKVVEFIAPQIWASRPHRIKKIKKNVDKVLCTLPFEEEIYQAENIPVRYVGNPVASAISPPANKAEISQILFGKEQKTKFEDKLLVGLFPGSRNSEIKNMLPIMIEAAREIKAKAKYDIRFVLAQAPNIKDETLMKAGLKEALEEELIYILKPSQTANNNHKLLSAADLLWLCSGTVTLEAAIYGTPYFLAYKGDWLSYQLYKIFKLIDMAGLANIIAGEYIVPEFLQYDATTENFVNQTLAWLSHDNNGSPFNAKYDEIKNKLLRIKDKLTAHNTAKLVADEVLKIYKKC